MYELQINKINKLQNTMARKRIQVDEVLSINHALNFRYAYNYGV